jgi:hypothetical protein
MYISYRNVGIVYRNVHILQIQIYKKVKESHNRPGVAQRVPGSLASQIS